MISYETAVKLWKAGFPLGYYGESEKDSEVPTLSELIEACGDRFFSLCNFSGLYQAMGEGKSQSGPSPEEAVANLYLSLNNL